MTKITRKRALEIAQECIEDAMKDAYKGIMDAERGKLIALYGEKSKNRYAELAAALQVIENMARQGEMHL